MRFHLSNTMAGLTLGVSAVVALAVGTGAWLYGAHHYERLLDSARETALGQADLIRVALEHQMVENDRSLIDQMIRRFGAEPGVEAVRILDREGRVRYASVGDAGAAIVGPTQPGASGWPSGFAEGAVAEGDAREHRPIAGLSDGAQRARSAKQAGHAAVQRQGGPTITAGEDGLDMASPTCQVCHRLPPAERSSNQVIETREGSLLRTVIPIANQSRCHACHDPSHRINGILLVDMDAGRLKAELASDLRWMSAASVTLALVLLAAISMVVRLAVMRRLKRFETTARLIAEGDLDRRVPVRGSDTVSWLAREFNAMADAMSGLLAEVRKQRERLETVINSVDDGIVVLDASWTVIAANDSFLQRVGRPRGEVLGCSCRRFATDLCPTPDCPSRECFRSGQRQVRICARTLPDGRTCHEEVHSSPVRDSDGNVAYVVEVWRDISDRRAAEARLAESHRMASLGMLASGFSHELNTPLATVLACVEGILRTVEGPTPPGDGAVAEVAEDARVAREQLLRCRGITQHFLRLSRGHPGEGDLLDVVPLVRAVANLIEPTARERAVRIGVGGDPGPVNVRADEAELQHALMNLMLNAVQACGRDGRVQVDVAAGDPVRIRVADTGCGIEPEQLRHVFEPFFSLRPGGTGLGLFLSMNALRRWDGDIRATSEPGRGSTFEIVLPAPAAGGG